MAEIKIDDEPAQFTINEVADEKHLTESHTTDSSEHIESAPVVRIRKESTSSNGSGPRTRKISTGKNPMLSGSYKDPSMFTLDDIENGSYNPNPLHLDLVKRALSGTASPLEPGDFRQRTVSFEESQVDRITASAHKERSSNLKVK